jgi:hypothetical protein
VSVQEAEQALAKFLPPATGMDRLTDIARMAAAPRR